MSVIRSPSCTLTSSAQNKLAQSKKTINSQSTTALFKMSPNKSQIKNTFYGNTAFPHISSEKIASLSTKKFERIPLSRSRRAIKQQNHHLFNMCRVKGNGQNKDSNLPHGDKQGRGTLYDTSIINKAYFADRIEQQKLIKIRQKSLKRLISHQIQSNKKTLWVSPHTSARQNGTFKSTMLSIKKAIANNSKTVSDPPPASIALNYLIHQYNNLFKQQKLKNEFAAGLSRQTLMAKCNHFKSSIKNSRYIQIRVFAGIRQNDCFDVRGYIKFHSIFVGKTAKSVDKLNFITYFFIPQGDNSIQLQQLKLIIDLLCQKQDDQNPQEMGILQLNQRPISDILLQSLMGGDDCTVIDRIKLLDKFKCSQEIADILIQLMKK